MTSQDKQSKNKTLLTPSPTRSLSDSDTDDDFIDQDGKYWVHWPVHRKLITKLTIQNCLEYTRRQRVAFYQSSNEKLEKEVIMLRETIKDLKLKMSRLAEGVARMEFLLKDKDEEAKFLKKLSEKEVKKEKLDDFEQFRRPRQMRFDLSSDV